MRQSGTAAQGYEQRLRDVQRTGAEVNQAEKAYNATLLDTRASLRDVQVAHERVTEAKKQHAAATNAERDASRALSNELNVGGRVMRSLSGIIPALERNITRLSTVQEDAERKSTALARGLTGVAKVLTVLGPEAEGVAGGLELAAKGFDGISRSASAGSQHVRNFIRDIAGFEAAFAKIGGMTLALPSLGGLAGLAGAAGVQGIIEVADAVRQLSGGLGLLPSVIAGVGFSMGTLKLAFHGVSDALKDMMSDDPKKFLQDIAEMGPAAAHTMLQIANFRDMFKLAGGAVQDSFFTKVMNDVAPLIQTWLPALTAAMSRVAGIFGEAADILAKGFMTPQAMADFQMFVDNISKGLQAMMPAMQPLLDIFTTLTVVGSGFFQEIGQDITRILGFFDQVVQGAAQSGALQQWIQTAINAFDHLVNIAYSFGASFNSIMSIADKFGGGGLLGFLDKITAQLNGWTQSEQGQKALADFFSTLRTATDAFTPMLKPLLDGLVALSSAFVNLGVATAPGWQTVFNTFASTMQALGPSIVGMAPAINSFLTGMSTAFAQLMATIGPQLPQIFQDLANAFVALLPQLQPLVQAFLDLVEHVGPQLPKFFGAITSLIQATQPYWPIIIGFVRDFVSILTWFTSSGASVINWFTGFLENVKKWVSDVPGALTGIGNAISNFFTDLPNKALQWGKNLISNFIKGITDMSGTQLLTGALTGISGLVTQFLSTNSPADRGPLHDVSPNQMGANLTKNFAAGMASAQPSVQAAAHATADSVVGELSAGTAGAGTAGAAAASGAGGGAPAAGGAGSEGGALLPNNIAHANVSILDKYLTHEPSKNRGLAGLATDLGAMLQAVQSGTNLLFQNLAQPLGQVMGMIPSLKTPTWRKLSPQQLSEQQQEELQRKALSQGPSWNDVLGNSGTNPGTHTAIGPDGTKPLTATSTVEDKQLAIIAKGKSLGLSDQEIQGILGIAQEESGFSNVGFMGFGPEAKAQGIDIDKDPQAAIDLFFKNYMAGGLGSGGPTKSQVVGPGGTITDQQGFINFLWHRMQGAADPSYGDKLAKAIADQTKVYPALLDKFGKPTWASTTGAAAPGDIPTAGAPAAGPAPSTPPITLPPGVRIGRDGSLSYPEGTVLPPGTPQRFPAGATVGPDGKVALPPVPAAGSSGGGATPSFPPRVQIDGQPVPPAAPGASPASAPGAPGGYAGDAALLANVPSGIYLQTQAADLAKGIGDCSSAVEDLINMMDGASTAGRQMATSNAAQWLTSRGFMPTNALVPGAFNVGFNDHHMQATLPGGTPFNWGSDEAAAARGIGGTGAFDPAFTQHFYRPVTGSPGAPIDPTQAQAAGAGGAQPGQTPYPDVNNALKVLQDNTGQNKTINDKLLNAYLAGNPALASQIDAAKTPGASDQTVLSTLNSISTTITGLKTQDAIGNKNTIDALTSAQNQIAQQQGYTQDQSPAQMFSSIAGSASQIASSIIQAIQGGLDSLTATQDIADRLVYGVRNTEDINKLIDDVQKYITEAANIANAVGAVISAVGAIGGASGGMDMGASAAVSSAGQIAQLIGSILQGVNAAIDFGQEVYHLIGSYVGRWLTDIEGAAGANLMGNVHLQLDKNTNQLIAYSDDNPENKDTFNVPKGLYPTYDSGSGSEPNPQVNAQYNLYAGPGTSPAQMFSAATWMVATNGTSGALAASNF
ncbi:MULTISPECIES: hypothetical protein [unclassified Mycobacterium]|uniref:phage tail protein n=1 Tax=unclassified Mycobacterium TaxID=2642494 RepID=UPI0008010E0B|nr:MULTISPECIES: hypothetical protein [unclassified Mycobacterium]OBG76253.1 hypothetical protein A5700_22485 [Mycobacterium sp. E1214]OBH23786.1 hypothetical protein A5693_09585 [Mycobacterium sp. E1319]